MATSCGWSCARTRPQWRLFGEPPDTFARILVYTRLQVNRPTRGCQRTYQSATPNARTLSWCSPDPHWCLKLKSELVTRYVKASSCHPLHVPQDLCLSKRTRFSLLRSVLSAARGCIASRPLLARLRSVSAPGSNRRCCSGPRHNEPALCSATAGRLAPTQIRTPDRASPRLLRRGLGALTASCLSGIIPSGDFAIRTPASHRYPAGAPL